MVYVHIFCKSFSKISYLFHIKPQTPFSPCKTLSHRKDPHSLLSLSHKNSPPPLSRLSRPTPLGFLLAILSDSRHALSVRSTCVEATILLHGCSFQGVGLARIDRSGTVSRLCYRRRPRFGPDEAGEIVPKVWEDSDTESFKPSRWLSLLVGLWWPLVGFFFFFFFFYGGFVGLWLLDVVDFVGLWSWCCWFCWLVVANGFLLIFFRAFSWMQPNIEKTIIFFEIIYIWKYFIVENVFQWNKRSLRVRKWLSNWLPKCNTKFY